MTNTLPSIREKFCEYELVADRDAAVKAMVKPGNDSGELPQYKWISGDDLSTSIIGVGFSEASVAPTVVKHVPTGNHFLLMYGGNKDYWEKKDTLHYYLTHKKPEDTVQQQQQPVKHTPWWKRI